MKKQHFIFVVFVIVLLFFLISFFKGEPSALPIDSVNQQVPFHNEGQTYDNPRQHFSFQYGSQYQVRELINRDQGGLIEDETVVVEARDLNKGDGLEVSISPFPEENVLLTKERIQKDIPDMQIDDAEMMTLGGVDAFSFSSNNPDFGGASKEVWLVHNNFLFQISAYASSTALFNNILTTWKFQ